MDTKVVVLQTDGNKTNLFIYGANSTQELFGSIAEALKIDNCNVYHIDDIDVLTRAMSA